MIASMSRGADTYMYASGDESAMAGGGEPPVKRGPPSHGLVSFVEKQGRVKAQDMTCHAARAVPVGSDCRCKSNLSGSDKGYPPVRRDRRS